MADEILCPRCHAANSRDADTCIKCNTKLENKPIDDTDPLIGSFVGERFLVKKKLGEGGMGVVYKAEQTAIDRMVALKVLHPHLNDEDLYTRFRNEAAACSRLSHPNTITVYDFGKTETDSLYIAMEYIEGISLDDEILAQGALPWQRVVHIATQICGSLQEAHDVGIVHRDLKPENVMLCSRGSENDVVKVLDFGIAKIVEDDGADQRKALTKTGMVFGTPQYMSPEQVKGEKVDARSDIYSTGIIIYQMLCGKLPFVADTPMGMLTKHLLDDPAPLVERTPGVKVPVDLEQVVLRALAKEADDRYGSMKELADDMKTILASSPRTYSSAPDAPPAKGAVTQNISKGGGEAAAPTMAQMPATELSPAVRVASPSSAGTPDSSGTKGKGALIGGIVAAILVLAVGSATAWYFLAGPGKSAGKTTVAGSNVVQPPPIGGQIPVGGQVPVANIPTGQNVPLGPQGALQAIPPLVKTATEPKKTGTGGTKKPNINTGGNKINVDGNQVNVDGNQVNVDNNQVNPDGKDKDATCTVNCNSDKIAKSVTKALRQKEKAIKKCASKVQTIGSSVMSFKVKKNANKPSDIKGDGKGGMDSTCLKQVLESQISDTDSKSRAGRANFFVTKKDGVIKSCSVNVEAKPKKVKGGRITKGKNSMTIDIK